LGGDLRGLLAIFVGALLAARITGRAVFPRTLPHGQPPRTASRMVDEVIAQGPFSRAKERGKHIEAVRPRVIGQRLIRGRSESGHHIDMADGGFQI
jgi:hypothetical protein